MRVALCFSGQPRCYKEGFEYYKKNLLNVPGLEVDVFIHTWDNPEMDWHGYVSLYERNANVVRWKLDNPLSGNYNAKFTHTPDAKKWPPINTVSAYYSIFRTMTLKIDEEVKTSPYDWAIRTRSDFALPVVIPFHKLQKGILYMPDCRKVFGDWLGNDQFAIADTYTMNKYMSTYLNMHKYYDAGVEMIGEEMLRANLIEQGLVGLNLAYLQMPRPFPPGEYNGTPHFLIRDDMNKWTAK